MPALLITQCLQKDFVKPLLHDEPLPNLLHIGHHESKRLLGQEIGEGPTVRFMNWAQSLDKAQLQILHIRDWHDAKDAQQRSHLQQFGSHCIAGTTGAEFIFDVDPARASIVNSTTLNDFEGTDLNNHLKPFGGKPMKVGLVGVWTEAKILFLAYELATRYPQFELAVCSALTASSSRSNHFLALQQLRRIIGVSVFDSLGDFAQFLSGDSAPTLIRQSIHEVPLTINRNVDLLEEDRQLIHYLFRDCQRIELKILDGGFSGNLVAGVNSFDQHGHEQGPHVIKIGQRQLMAKERTAFEQIESVLGNNAPAIADYADLQERGAIKYRYASMGTGKARSFQACYQSGVDESSLCRYLDHIFDEQLGRFYRASQLNSANLTEYYQFSPQWTSSIEKRIVELLGHCPDTEYLTVSGKETYNIHHFYKYRLAELKPVVGDFPFSYIHGDLNGANIIVDAKDNVWLIDFFHTHHGHAVKDFAKLENDILFIYTPVNNQEEFDQACLLSELLNNTEIQKSLPANIRGYLPQFERAYRIVIHLRSHLKESIANWGDLPNEQWRLAKLRYAVHTMGFDECSIRQKMWGAYSAGALAKQISG